MLYRERRKQAKENKQLGLFNLDGIPAAPRGNAPN